MNIMKGVVLFLTVIACPVMAKNVVYNGINVVESESVSQPAVDMIISQAKENQWKTLRVEGDYKFKRAIWLTANANAIFVYGYQPDLEDINQLKKILGRGIKSKFNEIPSLGEPGAGD